MFILVVLEQASAGEYICVNNRNRSRLEGGGGRAPQGKPSDSKIQKPFPLEIDPLAYLNPFPNLTNQVSRFTDDVSFSVRNFIGTFAFLSQLVYGYHFKPIRFGVISIFT